MVYCCVGGCSNLHGRKDQKSKVRHFLRFYTIPKDLPLRKKWEARLNRRKNRYQRIYFCVFGSLPWFRLWAKPPSEVTDKLYPEDADTPEERERPKHWSWDGVLVYPGGQQCGESETKCLPFWWGSPERPYPQPPSSLDQCYHTRLNNLQARECPWFKVEDDDYKALFNIITDTRFSNDMKKWYKSVHTGKLESFHSLKLQYLPKSTGFGMDRMIMLTMVAALQNNANLEEGAVLKSYDIRSWSRASKHYILKKRRIYDRGAFKVSIIDQVCSNLSSNKRLTYDLSSYIRQPVLRAFHNTPLPSVEELTAKKDARMG